MLITEDGPADTVRSRTDAAGADYRRNRELSLFLFFSDQANY